VEVTTQSGLKMPLVNSAYAQRLDRCLLYLDDGHTRGSDFVLPAGTRAAVTLGRGLMKDKLVQACMRMRQLGAGHSVSFYASFEASLELEVWQERFRSLPETDARRSLTHLPSILSWSISNTSAVTCDQLPYFAAQGASFILKERAYSMHKGKWAELAEACAEREVLSVDDMYAHACTPQPLVDVVEGRLRARLGSEGPGVAEGSFDQTEGIRDRIRTLAPNVVRPVAVFGEEQETELEQEQELEEESQSARPSAARPAKPRLSKGLEQFAATGQLKGDEDFFPLQRALGDTSFAGDLQDWGKDVLVSADFVRTVADRGFKDAFLRKPIWTLVKKGASQGGRAAWVEFDSQKIAEGAEQTAASSGVCLLVSNFEAEALAELFVAARDKHSESKVKLDLVATQVRPNQSQLVSSSLELPQALHVFSGSFYGDAAQLRAWCSFAGLSPTPSAPSPAWDALSAQGRVARDFFAPPEHRSAVARADPDFGVGARCPFAKSPVAMLLKLYAARFAAQDLKFTPVGEILDGA